MENKRFVIYCPRTASRNFSFWNNPNWDGIEALHYASGIEAKTGLKTLMSPLVDRLYKNIVGKKNVHRFLEDRYYNSSAREEINDSRERMQELIEDADHERELAKISSIGEINSIGGIENAISEAKKLGNTNLQKKLESIKQDYDSEKDNAEKLQALREDYNKGRRVAHDSWFQRFRNSLGDRFLNMFGMDKSWDPRSEKTWRENYVDYLGEKNMPEPLRNLYNTGAAAASMVYKYSPEIGRKLYQLVDRAKQPIRDKVNKTIENNWKHNILTSFLGMSSVRRRDPRPLFIDSSFRPANNIGMDLARLNSQEAANLAKLRRRTP